MKPQSVSCICIQIVSLKPGHFVRGLDIRIISLARNMKDGHWFWLWWVSVVEDIFWFTFCENLSNFGFESYAEKSIKMLAPHRLGRTWVLKGLQGSQFHI